MRKQDVKTNLFSYLLGIADYLLLRTCHWCHVMEYESFEDEITASVLNENFICIKVDREERPDIDNIYMNVCQLLTGSGGWPLSIFMTPEQKPFFAGTYFPKDNRYGRNTFIHVLEHIHDAWFNNRYNINFTANDVYNLINTTEDSNSSKGITSKEIYQNIEIAFVSLQKNFDKKHGGIGFAPKFPSPHNIYFLLRYSYLFHNSEALQMAEHTLQSMYKGGIYDHIGFGFCRYSTDQRWLVPHFEKMLYDNSLLCIAYTECYLFTKNDFYKKVVYEILDFVKRELTDTTVGFYTAIDADSEGVEGKSYLWTKEEIINILGNELGEKFCNAYDITSHGNFEGKNIPNLLHHKSSFSMEGSNITNLDDNDLEYSRQKLLEYRNKRIQPHKDDKILTSLNGMIIAACSIAGRTFNSLDFIDLAKKSWEFIENNLIREDGRLLARYRDKQAGILAYADDYVYLIWGLIELYNSTQNEHYLTMADKLNTNLITLFWDNKNGSLFLYGNDGETLITRPKDIYDGAIPSSNSICAMNFYKLYLLLDKPELSDMAYSLFSNLNDNTPTSMIYLLCAAMSIENQEKISLVGTDANHGYHQMHDYLTTNFLPFSVMKYEKNQDHYKLLDNKATVYVCKGLNCKPPISNVEMLQSLNIQ